MHRSRLQRSFVKIGVSQAVKFWRQARRVDLGILGAKCRVREPFLAKSLMEESAEPALDFARLIGRSFVNR
jgi:hypothetical protein